MPVKETLWVGGCRNQHGTRISKKITCTKCGREDYITARPSKSQGALCKTCAQEVIGAIEVGKRAPRNMVQHQCTRCKKMFDFPANLEPKKDCLCKNCLKGFEDWQGSLEMEPEKRQKTASTKRAPGVLLRSTK